MGNVSVKKMFWGRVDGDIGVRVELGDVCDGFGVRCDESQRCDGRCGVRDKSGYFWRFSI